MFNWQFCKQILRDMQRHKVRSLLAMFGIIWGTVAVILLLALGESFYHASQKSLLSLAQGTLVIFPGTTSKSYQGFPSGRAMRMKVEDAFAIQQAIPAIQLMSPILSGDQQLRYSNQKTSVWIEAVAPSYQILAKREPETGGRFINQLDNNQQRNVIFLGDEVKNKLFTNTDPINKEVFLGNIPFTVIGVVKKKPGVGSWRSSTVNIPYSTAIKLWGNKDIERIFLLPPADINTDVFINELKTYLAYRLHFDLHDTTAITVFDFTKELAFFNWFFHSIELFLGFCGALTLAVGGIGIANVMFLIISERRAEIGLRMALGAHNKHIMLQFLLETALIIGLGALLGFSLSWIMITILQHISLPAWLGRPQFSISVLLTTFTVLAAIGLIAGYFPARRAANLQPIEALAF